MPMFGPWPIRWRLTAWYGLVMSAALTAFGGAVYLITQHHLIERIDDGLREELADVMSEVERATDRDGMLAMFDRRFAGHKGFDFQVTTPAGDRLFANPRLGDRRLPIPDVPASSPRPDYRTIAVENGNRWRLVTRRAKGPGEDLIVQVSRSLEDHEHELQELLTALMIAGPAALLLALGGGYLLARRALDPVDRMAAAARDIDARRLSRRVEVVNADDELGRLGATLNGMLDRLERSFREMQRFTADASHEIRTPLSVIRSEAEIGLGSSDPEVQRELLGNILEECERLGWITNQLLTLSREDAGITTTVREPVNFGRLVRDAAETMRPLADAKKQRLAIDAPDWPVVAGDPVRLRHVIYNLLDNAIKYTPEGGAVVAAVRITGREVWLTVKDDGVGITAEHLPHVFERFYRVDKARSRSEGGTGLGLAIVQSIVAAHEGRVELVSEVNRGTTVRVTLPISPSPAGHVTDP